jgi:hypothetical protein
MSKSEELSRALDGVEYITIDKSSGTLYVL